MDMRPALDATFRALANRGSHTNGLAHALASIMKKNAATKEPTVPATPHDHNHSATAQADQVASSIKALAQNGKTHSETT